MNEGDAEQWAPLAGLEPGIGGLSVGERLFRRQGDEGVESGIQTLDPAQEVPGELHAGNLALV